MRASPWKLAAAGVAVIALALVATVRSSGPRRPPLFATEIDGERYHALAARIHRNLTMGPHGRGVSVGTIRAVRGDVAQGDIPVLVEMLSDDDAAVAVAAADLLVLQGMNAVPALRYAQATPYPPSADEDTRWSLAKARGHARDALSAIQQCYDGMRNDELCPEDRERHRGERVWQR